jgi:RNA polymerase sigma factor (sigma-70 family)
MIETCSKQILAQLSQARQAAVPDEQLLRRFVGEGDQSAFAALVQRHGPLVLGVCRSVLRHEHDAEDAFQTTFLTLARSAGSIRRPGALACWLHGVAARVACKARTAAARRHLRESRAAQLPRLDAHDEISWRELRGIFHEELAHLPEKYRAPLLLCYWEGKTGDEAAAQLGCPAGTLKERLGRARQLLRRRLSRRGLGLPAALLATLLGRDASAVPARWVESATSVARSALTTRAAVPAAMKATVVLALGLLAAGAGALLGKRPPQTMTPPPVQPPIESRQTTADAFGDPLPPGAVARCGTVRLRHHGSVRVLTFAPDGKSIVSGGEGPGLLFWDVATGKLVRTLGDKLTWVQSVSFSADGKRLAAGALEAVVVLEVATGKELLRLPAGHAALSADGKTLAVTTRKRVVRVWDLTTAKEKHRLGGFQGQVTALVITSDGRQVAAAADDGAVQVWSAVTGKELFKPDAGKTSALAYDSKGKLLATGGEYGTVWLWDTATGKRLRRAAEYSSIVRALAFAPDGSLLATGYWSRVLDLRDLRTGKKARTLHGHEDGVHCLAFSPDGKLLASADPNQTVRLWDVATGKERHAWAVHRERVVGVALSPNGKTVATASWDRTVRLWDAATGRERRVFRGHGAWVGGVAWAPDGRLIASADHNHHVLLWEAATGRILHKVKGGCVAFSPDGKVLATGGFDPDVRTRDVLLGLVRLWDVAGGKEVRRFRGHLSPVICVAFSPNGRLLASGGQVVEGPRVQGEKYETESIRIWDIQSGRVHFRFGGWRGCNCLAFAPDGRSLASTSMSDSKVHVWETATGRERVALPGRQDVAWALAFAPDGRTLAVGDLQHTIQLWDWPTGRRIGVVAGHRGWVLSLAFSADGKRLVSGSGDTTALVWDTARLRAAVPRPSPAKAKKSK